MPDYSVKLTQYGRAAIALAETSGTPLVLSAIAVGDSSEVPTDEYVALGHEVHRAVIFEAAVDALDPGLMRFTATISAEYGGFWIREVGVFDSTGGLVYVAAFPEEYKPLLPSSVAKECVINLLCTVGNAANVTVNVDPSSVIATQKWVAERSFLPEDSSGRVGFKVLGAAAPAITVKTALEDAHVTLRRYGGHDDWSGPADGIGAATDNWPALQKILEDYPAGCVIDLPKVEGGTYYFSAINYDCLDGFMLNPDPGVTLRFPAGWATTMAGVKCARPVHLYFEDLKYSYWYSPHANKNEMEKSHFLYASGLDQSRVIPIDLASQGGHVVDLLWPDGSFTEVENATGSYDCTLNPPSGYSFFRLMMLPAFAGEEINVCFRDDSNYGAGFLAFGVKLSNGFAAMYQAPGGQMIPQCGIKNGASAANVVTNDYVGRGTHASYWPEKSLCSIRVNNSRSFSVLYNGIEIWQVSDTGADILEVGFGGGFNTQNAAINLTHWTRSINKPFGGKRPLNLVVIGDSITDTTAQGSWTYPMREALENTHGIRVAEFLSLAVSGEASGQQLARLQAAHADGTLDAFNGGSLLIQVGANDIQRQTAVATYVGNVEQMIQIGKAHHMTIVGGVPTLFYTRGQSEAYGGLGQDSVNYDRGAAYRAAVLYSFAINGVKPVPGVLEDMGPILASYLSTGKDPIMRDNIHPTAHGYRLMGYAYARAVAGALIPKVSRMFDRQPLNGYAAIAQTNTALFEMAIPGNEATFRVSEADQVEFNGWVHTTAVLEAGQVGVAISFARLPRAFWPESDIRLTVPATTSSGSPLLSEVCMLHVRSDGLMVVYFGSTAPRGFYLDGLVYSRAFSDGRR